MQATFGDSAGAEKGGASGRDIEAQDARRLAENQERNQRDEKTVGGSAGRAQVADKDPKGISPHVSRSLPLRPPIPIRLSNLHWI